MAAQSCKYLWNKTMSNYFSQANNFADSAVGFGVDPRTGQFSCSLDLAVLVGNDAGGPFVTLKLIYDPRSAINHGFGYGWQINWSTYDAGRKVLTLASGLSYAVQENRSTGACTLRHQKIANFAFNKSDDNAYYITEANGSVTVLQGDDYGSDVKMPQAMFSANGAGLYFNWMPKNSQENWLQSINDDNNNTLLQIDYDQKTIIVFPDKSEQYIINFTLDTGGLLSSIAVSDMQYTMNYDPSITDLGAYPLIRLQHPTGLIEEVKYTTGANEGHQFPACANAPNLPYVKEYTTTPTGGQPPLTTTYSFSDNNFLGYGSGITIWSKDDDNIYSNPFSDDFTYTSTITNNPGGDEEIVTINTYNMFHLLINSKKTNSSFLVEVDYTHNLSQNLYFDDQDINFQQPSIISTTYSNNSATSTEKVSYTYDDYGNTATKTDRDGSIVKYEYYPYEGSGDSCPAAPLKRDTFVKYVTHTPAQTANTGQTTQQNYTYTSIPIRQGLQLHNSKIANPLSSHVITREVSHFSDGVILSKVNYQYNTDVNSPDHSRMISSGVTTYASDTVNYLTKTDYTYRHLENDVLERTDTDTTHDNIQKKSVTNISKITMRSLSSVDSYNNKTVFEYDEIGRMTSNTTASGSSYEYKREFSYGFENVSGQDAPLMTTLVSDQNGVINKSYYNCYNKSVKLQLPQFNGKSFVKYNDHRNSQYDAFGRLTKDVYLDYNEGQVCNIEQDVLYDAWGQQTQLKNTTGEKYLSEYDPTTRQIIERYGADGTARRITYFDDNFIAYKICEISENNEILSQRDLVYDSSHRLLSSTSYYTKLEGGSEKNTTKYEYDSFGRRITTIRPDGSSIKAEYADFTKLALVTKLSYHEAGQADADGVVIGTQEFDSLGRIVRRTYADNIKTYTYEGCMPVPSQISDNQGTSKLFTYIPELNFSIESFTTDDGIKKQYTYDLNEENDSDYSSALLKSVQETGGAGTIAIDITRDVYGRVLTRTLTNTNTKDQKSAHFDYSLLGALLNYQDETGRSQTYTYDDYGRISVLDDGVLRTTFSYDTQGRLYYWVVDAGERYFSTSLTFDDLNRVKKTEILDSLDNSKYTSEVEYYETQLLKKCTKTHLDSNNNIINSSTETYEYDSLNRLSNYVCSGPFFSVNEDGKPIKTQIFSYDGLNNITKSVTSFDGDDAQETITYYYNNSSDKNQLSGFTKVYTGQTNIKLQRLQYDAWGRLIQDDAKRQMKYDSLGRLTQVSSADGTNWRKYIYDANDILRGWENQNEDTNQFFYLHSKLSAEIFTAAGQEPTTTHKLVSGEHSLGQHNDQNDILLYGSDLLGSPWVTGADRSAASIIGYSPYGMRDQNLNENVIGFTGQKLDSLLGGYHLGNGYRVYSPFLNRFTSRDSLSPFGRGGLNPYTYCAGDPINFSDPTGHWRRGSIAQTASKPKVSGWLIALSVLELVISTATILVSAGVGAFGVAGDLAAMTAAEGEAASLADSGASEAMVASVVRRQQLLRTTAAVKGVGVGVAVISGIGTFASGTANIALQIEGKSEQAAKASAAQRLFSAIGSAVQLPLLLLSGIRPGPSATTALNYSDADSLPRGPKLNLDGSAPASLHWGDKELTETPYSPRSGSSVVSEDLAPSTISGSQRSSLRKGTPLLEVQFANEDAVSMISAHSGHSDGSLRDARIAQSFREMHRTPPESFNGETNRAFSEVEVNDHFMPSTVEMTD